MYDWAHYIETRRSEKKKEEEGEEEAGEKERGAILWKCSPYYDEETGSTWIPTSALLDSNMHRCAFEDGTRAVVDLEKECERTMQVPAYIPTRAEYYEKGRRYPHMLVHPNDPLGEQYLRDLREHWERQRHGRPKFK